MERTASDWRTANPFGALVLWRARPRGLDSFLAHDISEFPDKRVAESANPITR